MQSAIETFLAADRFAVAGASNDRNKYGNIVFRALLDSGRQTIPINPNADQVEGEPCVAAVGQAEPVPTALSIVTPPEVTAVVVAEAVQAGVKYLWMQPGAQHAGASEQARAAGLTVIDDGSCVLVELARSGR